MGATFYSLQKTSQIMQCIKMTSATFIRYVFFLQFFVADPIAVKKN